MLERSAISHGVHVEPASSARGALPQLETFAKPPLAARSKKVEQVPRKLGELGRAEIHKRSSNSGSSIPPTRVLNGPIFNEISTGLRAKTKQHQHQQQQQLEPLESPRKNPSVQLSGSIVEAKFHEEDEIPEAIIQVRKDSALYIDDKSDEATDLRDSLVTIGVGPRSATGVIDQQVEEAVISRLARPRARRESSGYFSNLGTFDEDRWTGGCCADTASQQEARDSQRERSRSAAKNRVSMGVGQQQQQVNRMTSLVCPASEEIAVSTTDNDVTNSGKVGRLEMPNIAERTSLELAKSVDVDRPADDDEDDAEMRDRMARITLEKSAPKTRSENSTTVKKTGDSARKDDEADEELSGKLGGVDLGPQWTAGSRAANRQRSRMVVHQYSSPNITSTELARIVERPHSETFVAGSTTEFSRPDAANNNVIKVVSPTEDSEEEEEEEEDDDDDEQVVAANLGGNEGSRENEADARKLLPRSIKVYQLLSTQSEDRGDGDARQLFDRRISLQIPRPEEETAAMRENDQPPATSAPTVAVFVEEKKLVHADSVPILKIPSSDSTTVENELRLCAGGRTPGAGNPAGPAIPGIRPIYPYCPYSPYASPQGSPRTNRRRPLRESRRVSIDSRQGALQLNQYKLLNNIGQGSYGIVKLAYNEEDETHYAMKILSKKKLMKKAGIFGRIAPGRKGVANPLAKVYREIALLKKLDHPNVVKLVEVLDDPDEDNLYLVFELVQRGEVLQLPTEKPLDEETARIHFRDVVMGVEYLHYQRIVHRDIKPSNLLVDSEGRVKVADLGVSAELRAAGELLSGSAGTPAFAAPETTTPGAQYSGTLCDVWSMGVTLYSLVTGKVPWDGAGSIIGVQSAVRTEPLRFPASPRLSDDLRDLVSRMLAKDPARRMTLAEIKEHPWLTKHGEEPLPNEADNCRLPVTVTDEEVARVVTRVPKLDTLILIKTMLKQHSFQNPFLPRRIVRSGCATGDPGTSMKPSLKQQVSSDTTDSSTELLPTAETLKSKTEQFHKAGRSNSAPDSYEWQTNGRQISSDSLLPPVTESSSQEQQAEVEKR